MSSAKRYTSDDLIKSVKLRGSVPEAEGVFEEDDLLRFANEEMDENLSALILSTREEIYLTYEDFDIVDDQRELTIPYRAIGSKVRIIKPLNDDNQEGMPLTAIALDVEFDFKNIHNTTGARSFYLRNDKIILTGNPAAIGASKLRVYYYMRPNNIVGTDKVSTITSVDTTTGVVEVDNIPENIETGAELDIVQSLPNHKILGYDLNAAINTLNNEITFNPNDLPEGLSVGDYICLAGETPTPQIPVDIIPILEQSVVCKILESIGDTEGLKNAYARLEKLEKRLFNIIDNRIESPGKVIVQTKSLLRSHRRGRYSNF